MTFDVSIIDENRQCVLNNLRFAEDAGATRARIIADEAATAINSLVEANVGRQAIEKGGA
jgi:hypothetical protein